ncbi:MAG: 5-formyltetrahydrofolate cyclo-ligase [Rhodospirillales bacterium]|jgi:5-formyltetrahydrofolate cyclo-ligase|nr:5-formyltetrahydrofolate cyclo-ligase [Rhodospirillales bacterium]
MKQQKAQLRAEMRRRRQAFCGTMEEGVGRRIHARFMDIAGALDLRPGVAVAAYWPVGDEADVRPLLSHLHLFGAHCLLPVVVAAGEPLVFRRWRPGQDLEGGPLRTLQPAATAAQGVPTVLLVPLLAFDRRGNRLGQGGGFYDRTLTLLRRQGSIEAIGVGYACQEVETVPHGPTDARLDWVVTEQSAFRTENP